MTTKIYTVYDKKAQTTQPIYEAKNNLIAIRDFSMLCQNDKVEMLKKFPDDYCLMCLGELNQETGAITSNAEIIAEAKDYVVTE